MSDNTPQADQPTQGVRDDVKVFKSPIGKLIIITNSENLPTPTNLIYIDQGYAGNASSINYLMPMAITNIISGRQYRANVILKVSMLPHQYHFMRDCDVLEFRGERYELDSVGFPEQFMPKPVICVFPPPRPRGASAS
jgi:hypothetical protein